MLIDCYGYESRSINYQTKEKHVHECATSGNFTYIRFSTEDTGPVHRVDETDPDNPKILWAYGSWADRENLVYTADKNTPLEIEANA